VARRIKIWYDAEGDFLEVLFSEEAGYMRETNYDDLMERVDEEGNILGFSVMRVSRLREGNPLLAELVGPERT